MLTLGKEIVATYITKTFVANCNKSSIFDFFFQGIRSKPKHRVLILVGLFLM